MDKLLEIVSHMQEIIGDVFFEASLCSNECIVGENDGLKILLDEIYFRLKDIVNAAKSCGFNRVVDEVENVLSRRKHGKMYVCVSDIMRIMDAFFSDFSSNYGEGDEEA